jgi:hypothetical protein
MPRAGCVLAEGIERLGKNFGFEVLKLAFNHNLNPLTPEGDGAPNWTAKRFWK